MVRKQLFHPHRSKLHAPVLRRVEVIHRDSKQFKPNVKVSTGATHRRADTLEARSQGGGEVGGGGPCNAGPGGHAAYDDHTHEQRFQHPHGTPPVSCWRLHRARASSKRPKCVVWPT